MREARDIYGFSPVIIQQIGRGLSDIHRQKLGDLVPKLSDFADSSQTARDADVVMALFNPYNHQVNQGDKHNGYDLAKLKDKHFRTFYRSLHILKNSFDSNGISFPMALHPVYGIFSTLPRPSEITEDIYEKVTSGEYFKPHQETVESKRPFAGFGNRDGIMEQVNNVIKETV